MSDTAQPATEEEELPPLSDALIANLQETAVGPVPILPRQEILRQVVQGYEGIQTGLEKLLKELNHPYRNWSLLLPDLRRFVTDQAFRYRAHPQGEHCARLFADFFFQALAEVDNPLLSFSALEGVTAYLEKLTERLAPAELQAHASFLDQTFRRLAALPEKHQLLLAQSHYGLARTGRNLLQVIKTLPGPMPLDPVAFRDMLITPLRTTYLYWLEQEDPESYWEPGAKSIEAISHRLLEEHLRQLRRLEGQLLTTLPTSAEDDPADPHVKGLTELLGLPGYLDMLRHYRNATRELGAPNGGEHNENTQRLIEGRKLRFMFHIMETEGLSLIHEETLREIIRSFLHLVQLQQSYEALREFLDRTFNFLNANVVNYPTTALQCIDALGRDILGRNNSRLLEAFLGQVVRFGFQYSGFRGVGSDWQPLRNPAHLHNIRVWLNLITRHPWWCQTLLSALIINLKLTGTCIRDTDLFQKEVTRLLNSDIRPVYNLVKQFSRLLPVFFNEIGAEGELRDVSTELDESTRRQDHLIHFLRKQCHVDSTNLIVNQAEMILRYWRTGQRQVLENGFPEALTGSLEPAGPCFREVHELLNRLFAEKGFHSETQLLTWPLEEALAYIDGVESISPRERRRLFLLIRLYQLLHLKYNLGYRGLQAMLVTAVRDGLSEVKPLLKALQAKPGEEPSLELLLTTLEALKAVILSAEVYPAKEEIFQKRHIAVDIPSVYGRYQEKKFDALSLSFRLEQLANLHLERLVERLPEGFITRAAFFRVVKYLRLYLRALDLDGISSRKLRNHLDILERFLELNQFSYHQYVDIFRGFAEGVQEAIDTYYMTHHRNNLALIVPLITREVLVARYRDHWNGDAETLIERVGESLVRDLIGETFGLQAFDRFISRLRRILSSQEKRLTTRGLDQLMSYDPAKLFCDLHKPNPHTRNLIDLGNKGFNLVQLVDQGAPVPPGVILTTEFFRCRQVVRLYPPAWQDFVEQLQANMRLIERRSGLLFGNAERPLLLSVRSGALISMPGMMQTIHNVGINTDIVDGLIRQSGSAFFAWDNYRRFVQSWSMSFNLERSFFSELMHQAKRRCNVQMKREFSAEQMRDLALAYRVRAQREGVVIPDDPWEQLHAAINQVVKSWNAPKAAEYRRIMNIANDWGTAVVLQSMVFGNVHQSAGTGVLFTANPYRNRLNRVVLWGDYTPGNQGEDIVSGLVATRPISLEQCLYDGRDPESSLERCFPQIFQKLLTLARHLVYEKRWNPQEMEFTFDGPGAENLFLLQTRDMVTQRGGLPVLKGFSGESDIAGHRLGTGIGVSGGALCGLVVFNLEQIEALRVEKPGVPLILIRYDTVPDDIREISRADGLLTARGGQTSHAAIVAARLEKTCVVGCEELIFREQHCTIGGHEIRYGEEIGIDGRGGLVLRGWHPLETRSLAMAE
ncbi:MAG: phosphoenolpyruvate synthase [Magnetococcales bacterium]|nr:phosphoenolpyruvate synthase [Magnetococcales bacterium]